MGSDVFGDMFDFDSPARDSTSSITSTPPTSDGFINPSMLNDPSTYGSASPWNTPQTVRTNKIPITGKIPSFNLMSEADRVVKVLNSSVGMVRRSSSLSDEELLGVSEAFFKSFANGREY
jgi:hypothetical protein